MAGRPQMERKPIYASIEIESEYGMKFAIKDVLILCPDCNTKLIAEDGMRRRKDTRVQGYRCLNPDCKAKRGTKSARQFFVTSSGLIRGLIRSEIEGMIDDLYRRGAKAKTVAVSHGVSEGLVSLLKSSVDMAIEQGMQRDKLVPQQTKDKHASMDETFFKIGGITIYVIIVRGYQSSNVIGINVSTVRGEADMRKAFDEAQSNSSERIEVLTIDALEASRAMARHLGYPITLIVHPHRRPYDKAIIERIEYDSEYRTITQVGVDTDIFVKRKRRQFHYLQEKKSLIEPPKRPLGRPKGSKNKKKKDTTKADTKKNEAEKASLRFSRAAPKDT